MSQSEEELRTNVTKGKQIVVVVLSVIYTAVNQLFGGLEILPELSTDELNIGLFVTASGAIIFGKGTAGAAAGLGEILIEFQNLLSGEGSTIHLGTLMGAGSLAIGTWITGLLGRTSDKLPLTMKGVVFSKSQFGKLTVDTLAAVIGTGIVANFLYVFGSQLQEGASIIGGLPIFLEQAVDDSLVLIIFVPMTLILFDAMQVFNAKKDRILESLLKKVETKIPINAAGVEIVAVELPKSLTQGLWAPILLKFKNIRDEEMAFSMEAVSTSKMYPHMDRSARLKPGQIWTQTFFALPSKQELVDVRIRILPEVERGFKEAIREETIVEFHASTRSQKSMLNTLLGFSGVNAGVLGISVLWDKFIQFIQDTEIFVEQIRNSWDLIVATAVAELVLFVPIVAGAWYRQKKKLADAPLKLSFSNDIDDQTFEEIIQHRISKWIERLKPRLAPLSRFTVYLSSLATLGLLGVEAYKVFTDPTYNPQNPELLMGLIVFTLFGWIFGLRGTTFLQEVGLLKKTGLSLSKGAVITKFQPLNQFQEGVPNEVVVTAKNPSDNNGIRILFEGFDTVSPNIMELHIAPNETAQFKIAVTPLKKEKQDILALVYPLYDENDKFVDFQEAEPFVQQEVSYEVVGQTSLGITKKQQDQLKKLGGFGGLITGALIAVNKYIGIPDFEQLVRDNAPFLAGLQAPFIYGYYSLMNRFKTMKQRRN